ncbi:MAG: hypothetical protein CVV21_01335 [Candidatus Goldiibacteriota bacterium HGW-Goldbacteria-1]|jgi:outer membrane protein TolC|nr:MAG: hypothetical protein CVV21_01335 [Candidatus Goldiibacteriota bacterium HGW-Goldbacteria-1]
MKIGFMVLSVLIMCAGAYAQVTEQQVIDGAMAGPQVISARMEYEAADAYSHKDRFLPNPMISIEYMNVADTTLNFTESMEKEVAITQSVPFPVKLFFKAGAGSDSAKMKKASYEQALRKTKAAARTAYVKFYRAQMELKFAREYADTLKQISVLESSGYKGGMDPLMSASEADIEYALAVQSAQEAEQSVFTAAAGIYKITGNTINPPADESAEPPEITPLTGTAGDYVKAALLNSAELKMAEAEKNMALNMRAAAFLDYLPDLNITYKKSFAPGNKNYSVMLMAEIPIWFLNNQQAMIGSQGALYDAKEKSYEEMKNGVELEVKSLYSAALNEHRAINLYDGVLIPKAQVRVKAAAAARKSGAGSFKGLLEAQKMLLMMQRDHLMHIEGYVMNYAMLLSMCDEYK